MIMGSLTPLKSDDYFWTNSDSVRCLGVKRFFLNCYWIQYLIIVMSSQFMLRGILQYTFFINNPFLALAPQIV